MYLKNKKENSQSHSYKKHHISSYFHCPTKALNCQVFQLDYLQPY